VRPRLALRIPLVLIALSLLPAAVIAQPPIAHCSRPGIVFIADGSGGLPGPSAEICKLVAWYCPGMRAEVVDWTYGWGMIALDMWGHRRHVSQGSVLAERIMTYRVACPTARIYLVGHSSGAAVVLAAAECLPPGSITGIILLAPCVSCKYDICPALAAACEGMDVFSSHRDFINLSFTLTGTSDQRFLVGSAGRHGFKSGGHCEFAANLRQHPGSYTGHFSCIQKDFLVCNVLPILQTCSEVLGMPVDGTHSARYVSPEEQERALVAALPPVEEVEETTTALPTTTAGRGGVAPISEVLRLP
jgi:hypothetical protein